MAAIAKPHRSRWLVASALLAGAALNAWQVQSSERFAKPRVASRVETHTLTPAWQAPSNVYPVDYSPSLRPTPFSYEGPYKGLSEYRAIAGDQFDQPIPRNRPKQPRRFGR